MLRLRPVLQKCYKNCINNGIKHKSTKTTTANEDSAVAEDVQGDQSKTGVQQGAAAATDNNKLLPRQPLAKNFFVGLVDKELLGYPEVVPRDDMKTLQNEMLPLRNFFAAEEEEVNVRKIDVTGCVPAEVMDNVRQLGLYGITVSDNFGGKNYNWTKSLMAMEAEINCPDIAIALHSHRVVIDLLNEVGTEEQRHRYLTKLASGSLIATEAIFEYQVPEDDYFNTKADYSPEANVWELNGEKAFVVTGPLPSKDAAQLFLVIAQTHRLNMSGDSSRGTTLFLVDSSSPGIKLGEKHPTMGFRGVEMHRVHFDKVRIPDSCVVGYAHEGNQIADVLLRSSRLRKAMIGLGMAKNTLNSMTEYSINTKQCSVPLKDMEMTQTHLSKTLCSVYAMESMIYLTAGLYDEFLGQDISLEAAMTEYFTLKHLLNITSKWMDIIGPKSLHAGQESELALRNASQLYAQGESVDSLRLYISISGLQHAGVVLNEIINKSRNPLFHPGHIFSKFMQTSSIENPKTKMRLNENLHPSLESGAQCIEHSVARLQMSVELLLTRYGSNVIERHSEMHRLTEMSTVIYAMFASLARASRSYCIGLQYADHELLTALSVASYGHDLVKTLCTEIFHGQYVNNDRNMLRLSSQITKSKGYFPVHPLTFNF